MNMKRITSLTALLSFIITIITSIVLYIVPHGRVAYWSNWKLWGLTKEQWGAIHINVGFLLIIALILHLYYNWNSILLYLKNKNRRMKIFTGEFNIAMILTLIFIIGTIMELPPFSSIIKISENIKETATEKYGEPPYGHAELSSLKTFTKKMGIDLKKGTEILEKAGFKIKNETDTLKVISQFYGISPQKLYMAMSGTNSKTSLHSGKKMTLPEEPAPGTGKLTLADFSSKYNLNMKYIIRKLKESGISSQEDMTLKKIGEKNGRGSMDIYEEIKYIVKKNSERK